MSSGRGLAAVVIVSVLGACNEPVIAIKDASTADRIWVMTRDGKTVLRCFDLTQDEKPYKGNVKVFCKEAWMHGTSTNPMVDYTVPLETKAPDKPAP